MLYIHGWNTVPDSSHFSNKELPNADIKKCYAYILLLNKLNKILSSTLFKTQKHTQKTYG